MSKEIEAKNESSKEESMIFGFPKKKELICRIESQMNPGELVVMQREARNEAYLAKMGTDKIGDSLTIAAAPTFVISGTGFQSDIRPLIQRNESLSLYKSLINIFDKDNDRVPTYGILAVSNRAVCQFFDHAEKFFYHSIESQIDFLRVVQELGMREESVFRQLQNKVANKVIQRLFCQIKSYKSQNPVNPNNVDNLIYVPSSLNSESFNEFVGLIAENLMNSDIREALSRLVNAGLAGLGLEVTLKRGEEEFVLGVDEIFNQFEPYYHPSLIPARVFSKDEWSREIGEAVSLF